MFFFFKKKGITKLYIISSVFGLVTACLLLGIMLRGDFSYFFRFVFLEIPRYKELMDGLIYPFDKPEFLFPVAIIALNLFWISYNLLSDLFESNNIVSSISGYIKTHLVEICLFIMSVFFFRSALGRSDLNHVIYSSIISYILVIYIFIKHFLHPFLRKKIVLNHFIHLVTITTIVLLTFAGVYRICASAIIQNNFPYNQPDSDFIPNNYKKTIAFINKNLSEDESFFTMTSEAIWYYYINKPSPTKFAVIWFAAPHFYQDQVVKELKTNNVKLILYKNEFWSNAIDGITSQDRLPIIDNYIKSNYSFFKKIDDNELWIENSN
jgi:hypothetical protein